MLITRVGHGSCWDGPRAKPAGLTPQRVVLISGQEKVVLCQNHAKLCKRSFLYNSTHVSCWADSCLAVVAKLKFLFLYFIGFSIKKLCQCADRLVKLVQNSIMLSMHSPWPIYMSFVPCHVMSSWTSSAHVMSS